ncbi:MAG TPA: hypothetical protein VKU44_02380 [Terriglobia bacterium]|nr:hypothetical protein [Terriglobia bacterium]
MLKCDVCGRPTGFWGTFSRVSHDQCTTIPTAHHINQGQFQSFDNKAEILLEHDEHCLAVVKGCDLAGPHPHLADNEALVEAASACGAAREDGLVKQDTGSLFVTDRRVSFLGVFKSTTIPLEGVIEVNHSDDALMIVEDGGRAPSYFILNPARRVEITALAIRKLTDLVHRHERPAVIPEPEPVQLWN